MLLHGLFAILLLAPLIWGGAPPWASGFLIMAILIGTSLHAITCAATNKPLFNSPVSMRIVLFAVIGWLLLVECFDVFAPPEYGRIPAISLRKIGFPLAFLGCAILGNAFCSTSQRALLSFKSIALLGMVLSGYAAVHLLQGKSTNYEYRATGLYSNPNRFAVMLVLCLACNVVAIISLIQRKAEVWPITQFGLQIAAFLAITYALVMTKSRLTMLSVMVVSLIVVGIWQYLRAQKRDPYYIETARFPGLWRALGAVSATIMLFFIIVFSVGQQELLERFLSLRVDGSFSSRLRTMHCALPLLLNPLGHGLGTFESLYTPFQPVDLGGRWREVHSDWMQLGIEAGIPCIALCLLLAITWTATCFRQLRDDCLKGTFAYRLLPMAAIFVVVLCSLADFPLRDPGSAMLVFFVAGALCLPWRWEDHEAAEVGLSAPLVPRFSIARRGGMLIMACVFACAAAISGRNALAYANTPWLGKQFAVESYPEQYEKWKSAVKIDPEDPELQYRFAISEAEKDLPAARHSLQTAIRLQPNDFRFYWVEASVAEKQGRLDEAELSRSKAISLAPTSLELRKDSAWFELRTLRPLGISTDHAASVARAIIHLRVLLAGAPEYENEVIAALNSYGCTNNEIACLWPEDSDAHILRIARHYLESDDLQNTFMELRKISEEVRATSQWYNAIEAALEIRWDVLSSARQHIQTALSLGQVEYDPVFDTWISKNFNVPDSTAFQNLAIELQAVLPHYPILQFAIAGRLVSERRWLIASKILLPIASSSSELSALYAEVALGMEDFEAANERALNTRDIAADSVYWGNWYDRFKSRIDEAVSKSRAHRAEGLEKKN